MFEFNNNTTFNVFFFLFEYSRYSNVLCFAWLHFLNTFNNLFLLLLFYKWGNILINYLSDHFKACMYNA